MVQVAGVKVGRINDIHIAGDHVTVDFDVKDATLGTKSRAGVQVLNLLGEKYLEITPKGSGEMKAGETIPVSRTDTSYDIVSTLGELTTRTEDIDTAKLGQALTTMGDTLNAASPHIQATFTGLSRISQSIASRDEGIEKLLARADRVTKLLADRRGDLVTLMKEGDLVFKELIARREAIHSLLVNANKLAVTLRGVATDNQGQIKSALAETAHRPEVPAGAQEAARHHDEEPRPLRVDPDQHRRQRPVVRRLRPQPPRYRQQRVHSGEEVRTT